MLLCCVTITYLGIQKTSIILVLLFICFYSITTFLHIVWAMSNFINNSHRQSDPYAGQYPPPPPLSMHDLSIRENRQSINHTSTHVPDPHFVEEPQAFYVIDPSTSSQRNSLSSSRRKHSNIEDSNRSTEHTVVSSSHSIPEYRGHFYEGNQEPNENEIEYNDPEAMELRDYLYAERQRKLIQQEEENRKRQQQKQQQNNAITEMDNDYRHHHPPPRPEIDNSMYGTGYYDNSALSPLPLPHPVMLNHQYSSSVFSSQPSFVSPFHPPTLQGSNPSIAPAPPLIMRPSLPHSMPPPMIINSNEKYNDRMGCCYRISCCSLIWTLLLIALFLGGVALIIVSILIGNRCNADNYATDNSTLCTQTFHDGFLYGGVVIAGLTALIVVWRLLKWFCR
ncbi:hypothetical protein EDC96DRAFT_493351 [Choanephora cucurbitarum]|nr:hypothetical protein EDC96DRAFT_493351 [Choanephora cucurbitarum]